jgi:hypothetical protein
MGLVSFDDSGWPLASPKLSDAARHALGLDAVPPLHGVREGHKANLVAHRARYGY